jgi:benzoyl-CoA reductase subunit A
MKVYLGIDLGSTTSKAVIIDEKEHIIGRGITNTRSNYSVAADIARMEAEFNSRFTILSRQLKSLANGDIDWDDIFARLENCFHYLQFEKRFHHLMEVMLDNGRRLPDEKHRARVVPVIENLPERMLGKVKKRFFDGSVATSTEFFRDLFSSVFMETISDEERPVYDQLLAVYDRSINPVENSVITYDFATLVREAMELMEVGSLSTAAPHIMEHLDEAATVSLEPADYIGTGYGRQLLPFEQEHIKSEILCHAMGAHAYFPKTRTVLDIGGQDTKAIQVDEHGLVTSFQMNDRCAAGCGRYLGYIADEMNISVSQLGPLALQADYKANICSTCTVFAGAELREYLNLGERKENILAGLHQAIVQRAFALLARSGGVRNEFTFTGGVARNPAVVAYVEEMVRQNYGDLTINIHPDSIFMGALGAALFSARRDREK